MHSVILSRKAELDQFAVGLGPVLGLAKKYPDVLKSLFVNCSEPGSASVTPAAFKGLLVLEGLQDKGKEYFLEYIDKEGRRYYRDLLFIHFLGGGRERDIVVLNKTCPHVLAINCAGDQCTIGHLF